MALSNKREDLKQQIAELEAENARLRNNLQHSEDLFSKIFHASSNVMAVHTIKDGRFVDLNEACARLGGFKREELIGRRMEEWDLLQDEELKEKVFKTLSQEGKVSNIESKIRTKDGNTRTVLFSADPVIVNDEPCLLAVSVDITEREREASALRRSEEKYRLLVENSLQGLTITQNGRIVFCNNTFACMFGYSVEEAHQLSTEQLRAIVHPEDRNAISEHYGNLVARKPVNSRFEFRGLRRDGATVWLEGYANLVEYNGAPAIQSLFMDITERKKAENALRESEERFRLIAETIDEIFWIYDTEANGAVYLSPAYARIWGCPIARVVNNPDPFMMDMVHPDDRERVAANRALLMKGQPVSYEYRIIRPDGVTRNIWDRAYPIFDREGRLYRTVGVGQDVTEWRRAEASLKEAKDYLNQIINCIGDPIFVKDREHRFTLVNDALCAFTGLRREDLLGTSGSSLLIASSLREQEDEVFKTGREFLTEDLIHDSQGIPRTVMAKKSLLIDKSGNKQVVGVLRDITEHKRLESQLLQSQKMEAVGVLAGGVAHDFNNLLNVINGYTELVLEDLGPGEARREEFQQIWEAGQRAAALTSQLLDFGRKQILQPEVFDLNHVIADMSSMLRRMIGEDIEIIFNAQTEPAMINADPGKIQQVVMNLAVNARDAMPDGGKVIIETDGVSFQEGCLGEHAVAAHGPYIVLSIRDTGIGMDAETQAHIFEPFFTTKAKGKGTGLGLSTVYGIVKQSGGFVSVHSETAKGTTIQCYFPKSADPKSENAVEKKAESETGGMETVLLVEDESAVRALAARILRNRGYTVIEAADGMEALRISEEYSPRIDLVLTDVVMPGMGGRALVARLEEMRPDIKTLYISGYTDDAISHHGILDSNVAFLQKPFTIEGLIRKVREVLDA